MTYMPYSRPVESLRDRLSFSKIAAGVVIGTSLAAAVPAAAQPKSNTQEVVVRLNGSSTLGSKMALNLAMAWAKQLKLSGIRVDAGADPDEYEVVAEGAESTHRMRVKVQSKGTGFGLEPMLRGQTDFWMASRPVQESDLENMRKKGVPNVPTYAQMIQPGVENTIALGAMAVIVNAKNPVPALSYQQLRDMFTGRATSWAQVGGPSNLPIGLYSPEPTLATADFFCTSIMNMKDTGKCLDSFARLASPRILMMEDISDAVAANPAGVSFIDFSAKRSARPVPLATDCGTGIEPSLFRIKTDEYPLTRKHYFYIAPNRPLSPAAKDFLQLTLGPAGQLAATQAGLADLQPGVSDANYASDRLDTVRDSMDGGRTRVRASDVRAFEQAIAGADRMTVTFHFQAGTNTLDARAEADLARLVSQMQQPPFSQQDMILLGYSGVTGDYTENRALSRERAEAVRDRLVAAGVTPVQTIGVGPAAAVSCNLDANTAPLNQRVEVWLRKPRG